MAIVEVLGASIFLVGYVGESEPAVFTPEQSVVEVNDQAVLPKVLRIINPDVYWVEQ